MTLYELKVRLCNGQTPAVPGISFRGEKEKTEPELDGIPLARVVSVILASRSA